MSKEQNKSGHLIDEATKTPRTQAAIKTYGDYIRSEEAVGTCGRAYCEHYPEGLPVCSRCREESTIAHDKACALLAEARADADHWKSECNTLQRMVHEARAEIERKDKLIEQMYEALELTHADFKDVCKSCMFNNSYPDGHFCSKCPTKLAVARLGAALAAERGE